jgi:ribosomal protein S27AE
MGDSSKKHRILKIFQSETNMSSSSDSDDGDDLVFSNSDSDSSFEDSLSQEIPENNNNNNNNNHDNQQYELKPKTKVNGLIYSVNRTHDNDEVESLYDSFDDLWSSFETSIIKLAKNDPNLSSRTFDVIDKKKILNVINRGTKRKLTSNSNTLIKNNSSKKRVMTPRVSNRKKNQVLVKNRVCPTCFIKETSQWRYDEDNERWLCNACGLLMFKSKRGGLSFEKRLEKRLHRMKRPKLSLNDSQKADK